MNEVTRILKTIEQGDQQAVDQLLPLVYGELRRLAAKRLLNEAPGQTLEATALVHEAYVRLVDQDQQQKWDGRGHFFSAAAEAMRRILVDRARRKKSAKHGGEHTRVNLQDFDLARPERAEELLALDAALDEFGEEDSQKLELVKLRYFAGLTLEQAAETLNISRATASRHWNYARAWLFDKIHTDEENAES